MIIIQKIYYVIYPLKIPCDGFDTTLRNGGRVHVEYDDYTSYPEYIVNY